MARPFRAAIAIGVIALGASLLGPAVAAAADSAPWVGTYKGIAIGKDKKGKKATSGVTIWVEDLGGSTKFTFRFDKLPVVIDQTGDNAGGYKGSMLVKVRVNKAGVVGTGMFVLYPRDGNYMIAGRGAGKAAGKQGTGRLSAVRVSTGVDLPSTVQQFKDLLSALTGKKVDSTSGLGGAAGGGSSRVAPLAGPLSILSDDAGAGSAESSGQAGASRQEIDAIIEEAPTVTFVAAKSVEPASVLVVATAQPPTPTQSVFAVMGLLLVLTLVGAVVGIGPKARPAAAVQTQQQVNGYASGPTEGPQAGGQAYHEEGS